MTTPSWIVWFDIIASSNDLFEISVNGEGFF